MATPTSNAIATFVQYASQFIPDTNTLIDAGMMACSEPYHAKAQRFFMERGFDGKGVTLDFLESCAVQCGWHASLLKPHHTFAEMLEFLTQYEQGLISAGELLLVFQLTPPQVQALKVYLDLPHNIARRISLLDWDEHVTAVFAKAMVAAS